MHSRLDIVTMVWTCLVAFPFIVIAAQAFAPSSSSLSLSSRRRCLVGEQWKLPLSPQTDDTKDDERRYQELLDWLFQEQGCKGQDGVHIGSTSSSNNNQQPPQKRRGLYATNDFHEGDTLFAIPLSTALVIEETETTDAERGRKFLNYKKDDAFWHRYTNVLPTRTHQWDPTPDVWTDDQIAQLEFPRLVQGVMERKRRIHSLAAHHPDLNVEKLQFATWLVESRSLTLLKEPYPDCSEEELETTSVMIPLLDMINHSSDEPNAELQVMELDDNDEDNEDDSSIGVYYAVVALEAISAGDEVTISYGTGEESSVELLQYYGFVPTENSYDVDMLEWGGDDCLVTADDWSTTLEADETRLQEIEIDDTDNDNDVVRDPVERTILEFRVRMKRALKEWEELVDDE